MNLDAELLSLLVCPACKGGLEILGDQEGLACLPCAKVYPIRDEIPIMLVDEAVPRREWDGGRREANLSGPKPKPA